MTECNGCGGCCDPVVLSYTQEQARRTLPFEWGDPRTRQWVIEDLTPITRAEGLRRAPYLSAGGKTLVDENGEPSILWSHFYECRWFDREARRCTNYEARPIVCREYPWLTGVPDPAAALPSECSFRADIGQPVEIRRPA